jgi:Ser/Thr protein kinase RdoA (MazF antagonist)
LSAEPAAEVPLSGGVANPGAVVRVGDTVRRPTGPHTAAVHAFLHHLRDAGFDGVPRPHGFDDQGREILDFVEGEAPLPPFPEWAAADDVLASVARLTRRFHDAAATFVTPVGARWAYDAPTGWAGSFVGHNDLCPENVIFRDGQAVAIVDFDFAGPADPVLDVAEAAYYWMPFFAPDDLDVAFGPVDQAARLRRFADEYRLPRADRRRLVDGLGAYAAWGERMVTGRIAAGEPGFVAMAAGGWGDRKRRAKEWFGRERARLERVLVRS